MKTVKHPVFWLVMILLASNIWFIAKPTHQHPKGERKHPPRLVDILEKELDLTAEQTTVLTQMVDTHRKLMPEFDDKIRDARKEYLNLLKNEALTPEMEEEALLKIGKYTQEKEAYLYEHFKALRAFCEGDQKAKFDELILNVVGHRRPPGHHHPPRPDR